MNAKVSVIIPAYNAVKTVEATVRNVLASTIPLEVWVVDDGSIDGTGKLLDSLAKENASSLWDVENKSLCQSSLRVIHQENCGAYQARLNALKQIRTPYFGFVDADDSVDPTMFEKMLALAEREDLDVVQCCIDGATNSNRGLADDQVVIEGDVLRRWKYSYLVDAYDSCFIWDKIYRNQYDFETFEPTDRITNFDDMVFNFQFFAKVRRMGFIDEKLYHYAQTVGSAVHSYGMRQKHDFKWMLGNHFRMSNILFPNGEISTPRLYWGHLKWRCRNLRNAVVSSIRSQLRERVCRGKIG